MTDESGAPGAPQEPVEARWARTVWWGVALTLLAYLGAALLGANWIPRAFPGAPAWAAQAWAVMWLFFGVQEVVQWARGKRGRYKCPSCGRAVGFAPGVGKAGRRWADACSHCGARLTYPPGR